MPEQSTRSRQQFVKLCECGCGQPTLLAVKTAARYRAFAGQPVPFLRSHYQKTQTRPLADRFWSKVDASGDCWEWTAAQDGRGYGMISVTRGKPQKAHRIAYILLVGPIPDGMTLDHLCRNRACVNPDHLDVVTAVENTKRGHGVAVVNGRRTHCQRGHLFSPDNTRIDRQGKRHCRACTTLSRRRARLGLIERDAMPVAA